MKYGSVISRCFRCAALVSCLIIAAVNFFTLFQPCPSPVPADMKIKEPKVYCNISEPRSDICDIHGDVRVHGSDIFVASSDPTNILVGNNSWSIRPYARKGDEIAMEPIRKFRIKSEIINSIDMPHCTKNHNVLAIVFSIGGYAENYFHAFSDVLIPLYLTSREFNGEVRFVIADKYPWWINKFKVILEKLSRYEIIDIDEEDGVHCFPRAIVGLKEHKEFNIDPLRSPYYSMKDFRKFLRSSYSLRRETVTKIGDTNRRKPRLLIISRKKTRTFVNEGQIIELARKLGYEVVVTQADSELSRFAKLVNSCDVFMGVHGAGLSNALFLPDNAIFIQVVPFGDMEWIATTDFGNPSKDMNLQYLEYNIREEESTLIEQYPHDHEVLRHPAEIRKMGWSAFSALYLSKQNVKLDIDRFRDTLLQAIQLLKL